MPISAVDCVQPALQHTREQVFTRFRFGQWSRLALVGILAAELHVGGCGFGNLGSGWPHTPHKNQSDLLPSSSVPFQIADAVRCMWLSCGLLDFESVILCDGIFTAGEWRSA